jgi:hypothetical protein
VIAIGKLCKWRLETAEAVPVAPRPKWSLPNRLFRSVNMEQQGRAARDKCTSTMDERLLRTSEIDTDQLVPGLRDFRKATDFFAQKNGPTNLHYLQANLLASFYLGLLARVQDSQIFISNACRACCDLLEGPEGALRGTDENCEFLLNLAFWSCLQVESDLATVIRVPTSELRKHRVEQRRELARYCRDSTLSAALGEGVMKSLLGAIQLQQAQNDVHSELYVSMATPQSPLPGLGLIEALNYNLDRLREVLEFPQHCTSEEQGDDIKSVRAAMEYHNLLYVINLPVLQHVLRRVSSQSELGLLASDLDTVRERRTHEDLPANSLFIFSTRCIAAAVQASRLCDRSVWLSSTNLFELLHRYVTT